MQNVVIDKEDLVQTGAAKSSLATQANVSPGATQCEWPTEITVYCHQWSLLSHPGFIPDPGTSPYISG